MTHLSSVKALRLPAVIVAASLPFAAAANQDVIEVTSSALLDSALAPENVEANAGRRIHVHASSTPYLITRSLVVPEGAALYGDGVMLPFPEGADAGLPAFATGTETRIKAVPSLTGDVLTLYDGASLSGLVVEDVTSGLVNSAGNDIARGVAVANQGNVVVIRSRRPNDRVSATISDCEIIGPNPAGIKPDGPTGRTLLVFTRNLGLAAPPAAETGSRIAARVENSIVRTGRAGVGIFAITFAASSHIKLDLLGNRVVGRGIGIDANSGVSRPDQVTGSTLSIFSHRTHYRYVGPNVAIPFGWLLIGSSGPPVNFPNVSETSDNRFTFHSLDDRIEGYQVGIWAMGARRFFGAAGPSNRNSLDLTLQGTTMRSVARDLQLMGAQSDCPNLANPVCSFAPGDDNTLRVIVRDVDGSAPPVDGYFANVANLVTELSGALAGNNNRLELIGNLTSFQVTNGRGPDAVSDPWVPDPDDDVFTGQNGD